MISDAPVPPSLIAISDTPEILPPVIVTLSLSWVAIEPSPMDVRASAPLSVTQFVPSDTITLPSL